MPELTGQNSTLLFRDDTPNRVVLDRILLGSLNLSRHTHFTNEEGSDFIDLVVLISRKMLSVWKHLEAYRAEEQRLRENFWATGDAMQWRPHEAGRRGTRPPFVDSDASAESISGCAARLTGTTTATRFAVVDDQRAIAPLVRSQ